jgi:hypothetical protein
MTFGLPLACRAGAQVDEALGKVGPPVDLGEQRPPIQMDHQSFKCNHVDNFLRFCSASHALEQTRSAPGKLKKLKGIHCGAWTIHPLILSPSSSRLFLNTSR